MLSPYRVLQPFIWVAVAAFILGFAAFLALGGGASAFAREAWTPAPAPISTPQYYPDAGPLRIA